MNMQVPQELIRTAAQKRYEWRMARKFPGDADSDWCSANIRVEAYWATGATYKDILEAIDGWYNI